MTEPTNNLPHVANIEDKMSLCVSARTHAEEMAAQMNAAIDSAIPEDIKALIADIKAEFQPAIDSAMHTAKQLEAQIRDDVLALGQTVTVEGMQVVYTKQTVKWNGKLLEGMAVKDPSLLAARSTGEPSTKITYK